MYLQRHKNIILHLTQILIILAILFARPFTGIYIGELRIGELLTGAGLAILLVGLVIGKKFINVFDDSDTLLNIFRLIFISFLIVAIFHKTNFFDPYIYKSSSFIWTLGFFFLGCWYAENKKTYNYFQYLPSILLVLLYIFTSIKYPDLIHDILIKYSDKFDTHKASEIFLTYTASNLLNKKFLKKSRFILFLFLSTSLMMPLFFYMSRGATIACLIFFITQLWQLRRELISSLKNLLLLLIVSGLVFSFSAINISTDILFQSFKSQSISQEAPVTLVQDSVNKVVNQKNYDGIFSFYFKDGRLFTGEVNANWRLVLWQDVITDMKEKELLLVGYGYSEIIPTMLKQDNNGWDGTNENVHNYFVQILARGGVFQMGLMLLFYGYLLFLFYKKNKNLSILEFLIPVMFVSLFDTPMESVRFPLVFYFFLAFFFIKDNTKK